MRLDDLFCFDCAWYRASFGVDCLRHTPEDGRAERERIMQPKISAALAVIAAGVDADSAGSP